MAVLAALFAAIGRQAGRVLTTALGWASTLLFGRVPRQKQLLLSLIALGSLAWLVLLLGTILPNVGTFLLTALPLPGFVDQNWVRLAMLIGALVVPLLVGLGGLFIVDVGTRPACLPMAANSAARTAMLQRQPTAGGRGGRHSLIM